MPPTEAGLPSAEPEPTAQPEPPQPEEDETQAKRRGIAERMAKLGGIRFGAPPPVTRRPIPPPAAETDQEPSGHEETGEAAEEVTDEPEEDEAARRQRIAARLAGMGGMRFGMLSGPAPVSPTPATARERSARRDSEGGTTPAATKISNSTSRRGAAARRIRS